MSSGTAEMFKIGREARGLDLGVGLSGAFFFLERRKREGGWRMVGGTEVGWREGVDWRVRCKDARFFRVDCDRKNQKSAPFVGRKARVSIRGSKKTLVIKVVEPRTRHATWYRQRIRINLGLLPPICDIVESPATKGEKRTIHQHNTTQFETIEGKHARETFKVASQGC